MVLRPASDADFPFLYALYASTRASEMALVDWTEQQKEEFLHMQFNAQHQFYHEHFASASFDVIEIDGSAVGRLYVDRREREIRIIDIALMPDQRGKGIGSELIRELIDEASASDRSVGIHVEHNNPALSLYRRLGFAHVHDEGVYYFMRWQQASQHEAQENTAS